MITWPVNSGPMLNQTTTDYPGKYDIINNFQNTSFTTTITLTGITKTMISQSIFPYYEKKSFYISITSNISGSPNGVYSISKNEYNRVGNITTFVSPGTTSLEIINIEWNNSALLKISKSGMNYDGLYTVIFTRLI